MKSYERTILFSTDVFEVVSCKWYKGSTSPSHDHNWSRCSVLIQEGEFKETAVLGFKTESHVLGSGHVFSTLPGSIHEITCLSEMGQTLHVYVPRIDKQNANNKFSISTDQIKEKISLKLEGVGVSWQTVSELVNEVEKFSITTNSPQFMNQLFSGIFPHDLYAQEISARRRTTMATVEASPVYSLMEHEVIQALGKTIGWSPDSCEGLSVSGGSAANFMSIHCAKFKMWPESKVQGIHNSKPTMYVSEDAHYSFLKGANALGFGTESVRSVPTTLTKQIDVQALEEMICSDIKKGHSPFYIAATLGTTVYGAFDPLEDLSVVAKKYGLWLHADAAWGAPALFSKKSKHLVRGIQRVDSLTFDAHKFFGSHLTCSFYITQHPKNLFEANDVNGGEYLFHETNSLDRGRLSWQCGRGPDVLSFWTQWKHLGENGMTDAVDRLLSVAEQAAEWIKTQPRLRLLSDASFLNICVEILPPNGASDKQWSKHVRQKMIAENICMVNYSTEKNGTTFLRLIVVHPQIQLSHIQEILTQALSF
jgi:glutamate/tyrosine decarboxylase-like PLP-dependent enzyme